MECCVWWDMERGEAWLLFRLFLLVLRGGCKVFARVYEAEMGRRGRSAEGEEVKKGRECGIGGYGQGYCLS